MTRFLPFLLSALVVVSALADPAAAQDGAIPLDTLRVDVSSRAPELLGPTTRAVEVLDRDRIRASPARTVTEALQWGLGVELMPRSPALADVAIRGSSFEQVLVLVDGVRMRDAQTGHFSLNLAVPLEQVERIEILRGPATSLYGADAMAGVINIVTRSGVESTIASLAGGSFDRLAGSLAHSGGIGGVSADLAFTYDRSSGHRLGTDYEMGSGRLSLARSFERHRFYGDVAHAVREFGADGFYGDYPSFERTRTTTARVGAGFQLGGGASVEPVLHVRRNSDDFVLYRDEPGRYRNRHTTLQYGSDLIGRIPLRESVSLAVGVHAFRDEVASETLGDHDELTSALSLELAARRGDTATASLGLRGDRLPGGDFVVAPALSAGWWVTPALRLRGSVGKSHRSPTWTERFYRDPVNEGSPTLEVERAWTVDAGAELHPLPGLRIGGGAFVRDASDLIDWARPDDESDPVWRTRNVQDARFEGIEAEIEVAGFADSRILAQGTWISIESTAAPGFISKYALRPQVESLALSLEHSLFDRLNLFLRGARERRAGESGHFRLDSRVRLDLRNVRVFADFQNVTDADYLDISMRPAPGRNLLVGLELRRSDR